MIVETTSISGIFILTPKVLCDERGHFFESYNEAVLTDCLGEIKFVQENESKSSFGVLRGLHFQKPPFTQAKLVRVVCGEVLDVVVDLRKNCKTYGKTFSIILNETNKKQLFIPKGFAHGFVVLSQSAVFSYKVDAYYAPNHESGILWNDQTLNIDWMLKQDQIILSDKDINLDHFAHFNSPFA